MQQITGNKPDVLVQKGRLGPSGIPASEQYSWHWNFKHVATLERIRHQNLLCGAKSFSTGTPVESWFCVCSLQDGGAFTQLPVSVAFAVASSQNEVWLVKTASHKQFINVNEWISSVFINQPFTWCCFHWSNLIFRRSHSKCSANKKLGQCRSDSEC